MVINGQGSTGGRVDGYGVMDRVNMLINIFDYLINGNQWPRQHEGRGGRLWSGVRLVGPGGPTLPVPQRIPAVHVEE